MWVSARYWYGLPAIAALARGARRLTPAGRVDALERRILLAGAPASMPLERALALKLLLGLTGLALGALRFAAAPSGQNFVVGCLLVVIAYRLPDLVLSIRADKRQKAIRRELPDTLDQITISVEAGLGFEAAVARAARSGRGPLAEELIRVLQDIQAGLGRPVALRSLLDRTDVPELKQFIGALLQAESYGIPVAQILRTQAAELRVKRRQRAEERAMKLPVKLIFPLVFCFLPGIIIVTVAPAAIQLSRTFFAG